MKDCTIDTPHMTRTTTIRMTRTKLRNVIHTSGMMYLVRPRMMVQRNVISWLLIMTILTLTWTTHVVQGAMINQNENKFNQQWSSGIWDYQDQVPAERLRNAAIGAVLVQKYASHPANCSILEVGCGEGAITDFLTPSQQLLYEGVDISEKAITIARSKRGQGGMTFVHANMLHRVWTRPVDVVICSEVLYYTEHETMIDRFLQMLRPLGVLIISLHQPNGKNKGAFDNIFTYAESKFNLLDVIEVGGRKHPPHSVEMTQFRIKVLQVKANHTSSLGGNSSHQTYNHTDSSGSNSNSNSNSNAGGSSSSIGTGSSSIVDSVNSTNSVNNATVSTSISTSTSTSTGTSHTMSIATITATTTTAAAPDVPTSPTSPTIAVRNTTVSKHHNDHHGVNNLRRNNSANSGHGHGHGQGQGLARGSQGKGSWAGLGTGPPDFKRE